MENVMQKQIELYLEISTGPEVKAIVDYELTQEPFINKDGSVGALINDIEIDDVEFYFDNGRRCLYQANDFEESEIKRLIHEYHDHLKAGGSPYEIAQ